MSRRKSRRKALIRIALVLAVLVGAIGAAGVVLVGRYYAGEVDPRHNASLGGRQVFPADNPWNTDVSSLPVDPRTEELIRGIGPETPLHPDFGSTYRLRPLGFQYMVVDGSDQAEADIELENTGESDPGPYPIPPNAPVEGGPHSGGDRHVLVIDRQSWKLYELFSAYPFETDDGSSAWQAVSGAVFDLDKNTERPRCWTSADAAGLPIFPGLVRYDEVFEQKEIRHALRFTVQKTRRAYVAPARHFASRSNDESLPPMGMRLRLRASFDLRGFPPEVQVILTALKKYGMFLADNGGNLYLSGAHDRRWSNRNLQSLQLVQASDFEVVGMGDVKTTCR